MAKYLPKYCAGHRIYSMIEFDRCLEKVGFVYFSNKIIHVAFVQNWQYRLIKNHIRNGRFSVAYKMKGRKNG